MLHNVPTRKGQMTVWIEVVQLASPLNLKSVQVYILEKTASHTAPITIHYAVRTAFCVRCRPYNTGHTTV